METPAVNTGWSCVFRGPEDGRRVFVVKEAASRRLDSGGDSGETRMESDEDALREPLGGMGVHGARSFLSHFFRDSSRAEKGAPSLRCSS